jgi:cobalamin biosynthesis protein CobT
MNPEKRILTYKKQHLLALDRDTVLGILLHELGHLHHSKSDWQENSKIFKERPNTVFPTVNALEDVRINETMSRSYQGSRELIDAMNELLGGRSVSSLHKMSNDIQNRGQSRNGFEIDEMSEVMLITMNKLMGLWKDPLENDYYDKAKIDLADEITDEAISKDIANMATTQEVHDFIENEVMERCSQYLPPVQEQGKGGSGDSESDLEQEGEGEGSGSEPDVNSTSGDDTSETESQSQSQEETEEQPEQQSDSDSGNSEADASEKEEEKEKSTSGKMPDVGKAGLGKDTKTKKKAEPELTHPHGMTDKDFHKEIEEKVRQAVDRGRINPEEEHRVDPFKPNRAKRRATHIDYNMDFRKYAVVAKPLVALFKNKFQVIFKDNKLARDVDGQKSGRVNTRKLYKFGVNDTKLFKKSIIKNDKSYSVAFLTDVSGSMGRDRLQAVFSSLIAFAQLLHNISIRYAIGFFGTDYSIGKEFTDTKLDLKALSLSATTVGNGSTQPSGLIKELLIKKLGAETTEVKIGIILTDGSWYGNDYEIMRKFAKQNPNVNIYIIGLALGEHEIENVERRIQGFGTFLSAETPKEVMSQYLEIAKRHLI